MTHFFDEFNRTGKKVEKNKPVICPQLAGPSIQPRESLNGINRCSKTSKDFMHDIIEAKISSCKHFNFRINELLKSNAPLFNKGSVMT